MKVYDGSESAGPTGGMPDRIKVGIAEFEVTTNGAALTTSGLGSCIGVAVLEPDVEIAGLVHVMLPSAEDNEGNRAKFADTGVEVLIEAMEEQGADPERMLAKIAGGSDMLDFSSNGSSIGSRNAEAVREALDHFDIPIESEDVGGDHGRSLKLESATGDLIVKSANQDATTL